MQRGHLAIVRYRVLVTGRVKGVGFRYHVLKLAERYKLHGFVANCPAGVVVEVEGAGDAADLFLAALRTSPPPYAAVSRLTVTDAALTGERGFRVFPDIL